MAKRINILSAGGDIPFADNGLKLSKSIRISEIEYHEDFKSLFAIDENLLKRITDSMLKNKYDNSQPIHIWAYTDETGTCHKFIIDGHTRLKAAEQAGFETVPYYEHNFETFEEAYKYVLGLQVNRRNLDDGELLRNISKLYGTDFIQNAEGKKSEAIAKILGKSDRTIEKGWYVIENAAEETLAKIDSGETTVNKTYKQIKSKEKEQDQITEDNKKVETNFDSFDEIEELSDSLEDNSGNPRPVIIGQEKLKSDRLSPEDDSKRTTERRESYLLGLSDGFYKALVFACSEISKGKTPEEVYKNNIVFGLSPTEIEKFELPDDAEQIVGRW